MERLSSTVICVSEIVFSSKYFNESMSYWRSRFNWALDTSSAFRRQTLVSQSFEFCTEAVVRNIFLKTRPQHWKINVFSISYNPPDPVAHKEIREQNEIFEAKELYFWDLLEGSINRK